MAKDPLSPPSYSALDSASGTEVNNKEALNVSITSSPVAKSRPWWQRLVKRHKRGQHKGKSLQAPTVALATKADGIIVCPHETLSWTAFQRILDLPGFLKEGAKLCALSPYTPEHTPGKCTDDTSSNKELLNICKMGNVAVGAHYNYGRTSQDWVCRIYLNTVWEIDCPKPLPIVKDHKTMEAALVEFCKILQEMTVHLCAHVRLHDSPIATKIFHYLTARQNVRDPMGQWIERKSSEPFKLSTCKRCGMVVSFGITSSNPPKFRVGTRKDLGNGTHGQGGPDKAWKKHLKH